MNFIRYSIYIGERTSMEILNNWKKGVILIFKNWKNEKFKNEEFFPKDGWELRAKKKQEKPKYIKMFRYFGQKLKFVIFLRYLGVLVNSSKESAKHWSLLYSNGIRSWPTRQLGRAHPSCVSDTIWSHRLKLKTLVQQRLTKALTLQLCQA